MLKYDIYDTFFYQLLKVGTETDTILCSMMFAVL